MAFPERLFPKGGGDVTGDVFKKIRYVTWRPHMMFSGRVANREVRRPGWQSHNLEEVPVSGFPTSHSISCWKQILLQCSIFSRGIQRLALSHSPRPGFSQGFVLYAATTCWYLLILHSQSCHPICSSQSPSWLPAAAPLYAQPWPVSPRTVSPGQEATQKPKLKLRTKRWPCKMSPSNPIPQVSSHGRVVHLSNVQKSLWHSIIRTGLYGSLLAYRNPGRYQCNGFSRFS